MEEKIWTVVQPQKTHYEVKSIRYAQDKPSNERDNVRKRRKGEIVSLRIRGRSSQCHSQWTKSYSEKSISLSFSPTLSFQCSQNLNPLSKFVQFVCWLSVFSVPGFSRSQVATFTFAFVAQYCTWDVLKGKRRCVLAQSFNTSRLEVQQCHTAHALHRSKVMIGAQWHLQARNELHVNSEREVTFVVALLWRPLPLLLTKEITSS